ncbi:MAG: hypothetical protein V3U84_09975 [Thiotrichaceae bacterium]|jgi:hypothetical protein
MDIPDRKEAREIKWMIMLLRDDKSLIKSGDRTDREGLHNRLQPFLKEEYDRVREPDSIDEDWLAAIKDVAKQLGVKLMLETKEEDTNQEDSKNTEEKK